MSNLDDMCLELSYFREVVMQGDSLSQNSESSEWLNLLSEEWPTKEEVDEEIVKLPLDVKRKCPSRLLQKESL